MAAAALLLAGCAEPTIEEDPDSYFADMEQIEPSIAFDLRQGWSVKEPFVRCPEEEVTWAPGETFECEFGSDRRPNKVLTLTVLMQKDGSYRWDINR